MRKCLYTSGSKPQVVLVVECDLDLLSQLIADEEFDPAQIQPLVLKALNEVSAAVAKGAARRKARKE